MMVPSFAVVGHPNKGKSSIVATLAEDDRTAIGETPGTTTAARRYTFRIDGEPQYVLIDTPGFQRAGAVLAWLGEAEVAANERPARVQAFIDAHAQDPRFRDECELLKPLLDGAGILYVVDGAKPYGAEYELEMQVLRWTGRPRMALINLIGEGDYIDEWREALGQYFSIVRVFDALHADFSKRIDLLTAFAELNETWREGLDRIIGALQTQRHNRLERSAREISGLLIDALTANVRVNLQDDQAVDDVLSDRLTNDLQNRIRGYEDQCRDMVQTTYRHLHLLRTEAATDVFSMDLFAQEGWELFGLSRRQIAMSGIVSGAIAGGGVDALLGGASMLLGAAIGAIAGGTGAWFGSGELASVQVLGQSLGGRVLQVGPVKSANFPWVLLGRAWTHQRVVAERNHARRQVLNLEVSQAVHLMDSLDDRLRRDLAALFRSVTRGESGIEVRAALEIAVLQLLQQGVST